MYSKKVREFTEVCNENLSNYPQKMSEKEVQFISEMVESELEELKVATDVWDQADALVDAIYYICDAAARKGINLDPIFDIVHKANMTKIVDGKVLRRGDGKIIKPEAWEDPKPKLINEVNRQIQKGSF